jgi:threonine aldolase
MTANYRVVELRSDTFTLPTAGMRQAIAEAEVGDDMVGEDPSVNKLEAYMAALFQKEAAVFCCTGSQSNQAAIWAHCRPGDEILTETNAHLANYESGGPAVLSNVMVRTLPGEFGKLDLAQLEGQVRRGNHHFAPTTLLCLENTTNIGGGACYSLEQMTRVTNWARQNGLKTHLDGARIMNACVSQGYTPAEVGPLFDTISLCFSKGLGCPMGSVLMGNKETIHQARRARKIFGGALRQAGMMAAAAYYAMQHHVERLQEDHQHARLLAEGLLTLNGLKVSPYPPPSNIVFVEIDPSLGTAAKFAQDLKSQGVNLYPLGPQRIRMCTHLNVSTQDIQRTIQVFGTLVNGVNQELHGHSLNSQN